MIVKKIDWYHDVGTSVIYGNDNEDISEECDVLFKCELSICFVSILHIYVFFNRGRMVASYSAFHVYRSNFNKIHSYCFLISYLFILFLFQFFLTYEMYSFDYM
jgi:hypothetical protein